ncbi:RecT family recombinase [Lederbergia wuyishanensis]|uniref:Recombination protein RecT n=1 Tax=Lederbergia wuyishanensis TaxID=1347903 RepID=A0ABU0D771_9BACI|nr:RecT family recombinase [Lederbergia wuyishanensis]MCJ8008932.1 recombinase RecT [Lederbergia wuyishanensis]MDQ0344258.1 recombination protein RecT [Lederbergia wuyishanensis]
MTTQIQKADPKEVVAGSLTRGEVATLKQTLVGQGINDAQFNLFIQTCAASGLNPFMNHIYAIPYNGTMNIQISVEGIHYLARQHPDYITASAEIIGENEVEHFEAELVDGEFKVTNHKIALPFRGKAVAAYAIAKRKDAPDQVIFMDRSEVEHLEKGRNPLWKSNFNDMFKKHVLKRALKAQFGVDIDDHTIEGSRDAVQENARQTQRREINISETETADEDDLKKATFKELDKVLESKKMNGDDALELSRKHFDKKLFDLNLQEITGLKRIIELLPVKKKENSMKNEPVVDAEFTEIENEKTKDKEPEKASAEEINFDDIDFEALQEEFPFD